MRTSQLAYERSEQFRQWAGQMPFLKFPPSWSVAIIPPFAGAAARFWVKAGGGRVSVYADFDESLGFFEGPYWEVYPVDGDVYRCAIDSADELLAAIKKGLRQSRKTASQHS